MYALTAQLETDIEILEAFKAGERERAATAFVRRHQNFVYAIALRHLKNHEDALDAAQETFVKALEGLDRFKGESSLQTWLYRITVNTSITMYRKKRLLSFFAFGEGEDEKDVAAVQLDPSQRTEQSEFEQYFQEVLGTLPNKQRETFCLRYYEELSYEEISDMVGTSVGALKANYHWAVKKIAAKMKESEYYKHWLNNEKED